ncbi:MAG: Molybdenum-containing formylmethanofuran dehydrogenase 1 subunit [Euryarchaeota archaeon]|nr:Molybdenum-containing formylmethanofuran dehydrogenase 1 subunit [Euryarchaeota archaeon]
MPMLRIHASGEKCLCDFTFDFFWQHKGSRLDMDQTVSGISFRRMVQALRQGETIEILGDAGSRLGSSMGVDLMRLGGKGGPVEETGKIIVDGNVGSHMGISMQRGAIYVSGEVKSPQGNIVQVPSDMTGYRKFVSATEILEKSLSVLEPNTADKDSLTIRDSILRDTLGARNPTDKTVRLQGDAGMSTGILMRAGRIEVLGDAGRNTGVLMRGGRIVVRGRCDDFTGVEMRGGEILVGGDAGSFTCAGMRGGAVYAREAKSVPPVCVQMLAPHELSAIAQALKIPMLHAMMYSKMSLSNDDKIG